MIIDSLLHFLVVSHYVLHVFACSCTRYVRLPGLGGTRRDFDQTSARD